MLEAAYVVFRLPAFHGNVGKRLIETPKLYFHDTGLACTLLGIRDGVQLRHHPLRGALFENWVVTEVLKACAHHGWHTGLFFLHDARGNAVDLLAEAGRRLAAVEITSSRTIAPDLLAGFARLAKELDSARAGGELETMLVYGDDAAARRGVTRVVPWHAVSRLLWG